MKGEEKLEKIITFEEEKRKEFLYVVFNAVFVTACVVFILNFFFGFICDRIFDTGGPSGEFVDNILRSVLLAFALSGPFVFYGTHSDVSLPDVLTPKKTGILWYIAGAAACVGVSFFFALVSEKTVGLLGNFGYIMNEYTPYVLDGTADNITCVIIVGLFSSFSGELVFRGILTERFRRANTGLALILPALIAACLTGSLARMPYVFVSGMLLSWIYMKSASIYATFFCAFITNVSLYAFCVFRDAVARYELIIMLCGLAVAAVCVTVLMLRYGSRTVYPAPRDDDDEYLRLSGRESVTGVFKSFSFWIFVLAAVFTVFFFYLSNPTVEMP